ncbi:MAG: ferritin-like domain-containing protein [Myxococcota bacterium]|nr:ferritin-like domain-containing protein [Deltaproteobacteria bacterium]MDQ3333582.1 ferritin-like domain-containing protein [Myxococcota bacterium]
MFIAELDAFKATRLTPIVAVQTGDAVETTKLLQVALANEINVSELAAIWMPSTSELDVKLAFARQAGDEAGHFMLVAERLAALGFDASGFAATTTPMFDFLRGLSSTIERVAASLFTLESIAYGVNENFMALCAQRGDDETVRIYREYIQPDEQAHQQLGRKLLAKYATTPAQQQLARDTVGALLDIAGTSRAQAQAKLGTSCFPGC